MAKSRKINRRGKAKPARQGSKGPVFTQSPRSGGGAPVEKEAPKGKMMNKSMKKPGSGTRGSGKGAR
jgi:hypothetical protein